MQLAISNCFGPLKEHVKVTFPALPAATQHDDRDSYGQPALVIERSQKSVEDVRIDRFAAPFRNPLRWLTTEHHQRI